MPGMTGAALFAESVRLQPDAVRITSDANLELQTTRNFINNGHISRHLLKAPKGR
jgi:hypothetical protein